MLVAKESGRRRLFMIRYEDGNGLIVQADNMRQALRMAFHEKGAKFHFGDERGGTRLIFVRPETANGCTMRWTIRELQHFCCTVSLNDHGEFRFDTSEDEDGDREFYADYPILNNALDQINKPPNNGKTGTLYCKRVLAEATDLERHRLDFVPSMAEAMCVGGKHVPDENNHHA